MGHHTYIVCTDGMSQRAFNIDIMSGIQRKTLIDWMVTKYPFPKVSIISLIAPKKKSRQVHCHCFLLEVQQKEDSQGQHVNF